MEERTEDEGLDNQKGDSEEKLQHMESTQSPDRKAKEEILDEVSVENAVEDEHESIEITIEPMSPE